MDARKGIKLHRETIRNMSEQQLRQVNAGTLKLPDSNDCGGGDSGTCGDPIWCTQCTPNYATTCT